MTIKSILCLCSGEPYDADAMVEACRLTVRFGAQLRMFHVVGPLVFYPDKYGSDEAPKRLAAQAEAAAEKQAGVSGLPFYRAWLSEPEPAGPHIMFDKVTGPMQDAVKAKSRTSDLIVVGRDDPDSHTDSALCLTAVLESGAPVMVVPKGWRRPTERSDEADTVALAWNGSRQAGRAMRAMEDLLTPGQTVYILEVLEQGRKHLTGETAGVLQWLARHGFTGYVAHAVPGASDTGEAILATAARLDATLIAMGAFGQSQWGQLLWGGVSGHVLKHTSAPLLLCH